MCKGEDGTIIAGAGRFLAARKLLLAEVPVVVARGWIDGQKELHCASERAYPSGTRQSAGRDVLTAMAIRHESSIKRLDEAVFLMVLGHIERINDRIRKLDNAGPKESRNDRRDT
jgi:hypothetical protein